MKSFKQFIRESYVVYGYRSSLINEELLPHQKEIVNKWGKTGKAEAISSHVIPPGQNSISIPLESPEDKKSIEPHPMVQAHLQQHGYDVHDYRAGLALEPESKNPVPEGRPKTKRRPVKIGAALEKTNAPKEVKDAFINDPKRSASKQSKKGGLRVMISRDPYHVAGMSTNQGWTSCMNMETGCNSHYLKHDVAEGTHVAYLYDHDRDPEAKNPMSRIALKPFHSEDGTQTILRPEGTYGTSDSSFHHTVSNWVNKNFPIDENKAYIKSKKVYHDSGPERIMSFQVGINHPDPKVRADAFEAHPDKITEKHIDDALATRNYRLRYVAMRNPSFSGKHVDHVLSNPKLFDNEMRILALRQPGVTEDNITKGLEDRDYGVRIYSIINKKANAQHFETAFKDRNPWVRAEVIRSGADPKYFKQARKDESEIVRAEAIKHDPSIKKEDLMNAMEDDDNVRMAAMNHPLADKDILDKAVNDWSVSVRAELLRNKKLERSHVNALLDDPHPEIRRMAKSHPLAPKNVVSYAFARTMAKLNKMRQGLPE